MKTLCQSCKSINPAQAPRCHNCGERIASGPSDAAACSPSSIPGAVWHDEYLKALDRAIRMERQRDAAVMLAGELVAIIRVNAMRGTWAEATPEQVDEFLVPWIAKLRVAQGHSPENASVMARPDGSPNT